MIARRKADLYRELFLRNPKPMWVHAVAGGRILDVNDAACEAYGYERAAFLALTIDELRPDGVSEHGSVAILDRLDDRTHATLERHRRADGSTFYADVTSNPFDFGARPARIVLAIDASARLAVSRALSESRAALSEAQELAHLGSYERDLETGEMRWSAELFRIYGIDPARERPTVLYEFDHPEDADAIAREVARARAEGSSFTIEHRIRTRDGRERHVFERGRFFHEGGKPKRIVGAILDITDRKRDEERLRHLAERDPLTELPNRSLTRDQLSAAIDRAVERGTRLGVLFVDLDRFKAINDSIAHAAGDELLCEVALRLHATLEGRGSIGRPGGDEFIIILENLRDEAAGVAIGYELLAAIAEPFALEQSPLVMTASVGMALFPRDGSTPDELLRGADSAMYAAKARGGNAVDVFRPSLRLAALADLELERALREALKRDDVAVAYQPIVDAQTGRVVAFEALARWTENGRIIAPNDFIPLAEATGLIVRLGTAVLHTACAQMRRLRDAGFDNVVMCVNISPRQFREFDFAWRVRAALEAAELPPSALGLEITESAYISADSGVRNMEALKEMGVHLSIDDFGTGYSSLGYLKRLPVDAIKIDRSFVADVLRDSADQAIIRAIIAVAKNLGLVVIAEGVETAHQADFLRMLGCTQLQGYFYARPLEPAELERFLRQPLRP